MDRRTFLVRLGGTLVAVPMVLEAVSCGSSSTSATAKDRFDVPNSDASDHSHSFTIRCTDLSSTSALPPYTATGSGHTHSVSVSLTQLASIAAGNEERIDTNDSHPHTWIVRKPAGVC